MEDVMIPDKVDLKTLCDECCFKKLLTKKPKKKLEEISLPIRESPPVFNGLIFHNWHFVNWHFVNFVNMKYYIKKGFKKRVSCNTCAICNNPLPPTKPIFIQEKIHKKSVVRHVKKPKVIKNFRRLN
jgi:hypothetical protein